MTYEFSYFRNTVWNYPHTRRLADVRTQTFFLHNVRSCSVAQAPGSFPPGRRGRCMWCISGRLVQSWRTSRAIGPHFHMPFRHAKEQRYDLNRWYPLWVETCSFFYRYRYCFCNKYNCVDCVILWCFTVLPRSFTKVEGGGWMCIIARDVHCEEKDRKPLD